MPKQIPACPKKPEPPSQPPTRSIEIITPMVGGGANAGEVDSSFPVRSTSIRGHLRHWWRLCFGRSLGAGMWQREQEIFGSTEFPSPLTVLVSNCSWIEDFDPADKKVVDQSSPIAYALFASIENGHRVAAEGVRFDLTLRVATPAELALRRAVQNEQRKQARKPLLPDGISAIDLEIDTALQAWLTFGGLGGRTRRGCGAVHSPTSTDGLPKIPGKVFVGASKGTAVEAWKVALEAYRTFRQTPRGKKHKKTIKKQGESKIIDVHGRSHWPEADSLRQLTGCSLKPPTGSPSSGVPIDENPHDHSAPVVPPALLPSFPKAVLGLPINFHFADGPGKRLPAAANKDPQDVQLYPLLSSPQGRGEKAERMASPVITRPLWLDGKWYPGVVILDIPLPDLFKVRVEGKNAVLGGHLSHDAPLNQIVDPRLGGLTPMRGQANALDALIDYLTKGQKWRVM